MTTVEFAPFEPGPATAALLPFSLEQYERMIHAGVLPQDAQVELIDGLLVRKDRGGGPGMTHGPRHASAVQQIADKLRDLVGQSWLVRAQLPISIQPANGPASVPEPDLAIVVPRPDHYALGHPVATEVAWVIEVADSSLLFDREVKTRVYAQGAIDCYWIVNLLQRQIEVFTHPTAGRYSEQRAFVEEEPAPLPTAVSPKGACSFRALLG